MPAWQVVVYLVTLLAISAAVLVAGRRKRYLVVGWFWYVGTLVPVIGLVQVGSQAMADRYAYLPMVGILVIAAWGAADLVGRSRAVRVCLILASGLLLTTLLLCTRTQVKYWRDSLTLFAHAIEVTENNAIMHNGYSCALYDEGRFDEALVHLRKAVRISPKLALPRSNLGRVLLKQRKVSEAVAWFEQALELGRDQPEVHYYLGQCYDLLEDHDRAISSYRQALRLQPDYAEAHYRLALVLSDEEELNDAVRHLSNALGLRPNWAAAHVKIGHVYLQLREYEKVVSHWSTTVTLQPDDAETLNNLAWVLATNKDARIRNPDRALRLAKQACELTRYENAGMLDTLAVCYAAVGEFDRAAESAATAISIAETAGMKDLAQQIRDRRRLYQTSQPYRER